MKNYEIGITETLGTYFVIEAESAEEAMRLFSDWSATDDATAWISDRLGDSSNGWEFSDPVETSECPDITHEEAVYDIDTQIIKNIKRKD